MLDDLQARNTRKSGVGAIHQGTLLRCYKSALRYVKVHDILKVNILERFEGVQE